MIFTEEGHRFLWHYMREGCALLDTGGHIVDCNDAMVRILGWDHDQLVGMHFTEITARSDSDADRHRFEELIEGKREDYGMAKRWRHKLGYPVPGDLYVRRWHDGVLIFGSVMPSDVVQRAAAGEPDAQKLLDESVGRALRSIVQRKSFWVAVLGLLGGGAVASRVLEAIFGG